MKLTAGIRYDRFDDMVYIRDTITHRDILVNDVCGDLLDYISRHSGCTAEELCAHLQNIYDVEDADAFAQDMESILQELTDQGVLAAPEQNEELPEVRIAVEEYCMAHNRLLSATLEMTYRCNERCIHCYVDDAEYYPEMDLADYRRLLDELKALGCMQVLLTGGEVLAKDCFLDVARYATSLGMVVDIYTNGLAMTDEIFDELIALHPNSISYSLYSGVAAVHDAITKVPGSFERTVRAAMMTKCAGVETFFKVVVMKENVATLESLLKLGKRLGIPVAPGYAVLDTHKGCSGCRHRLNAVEEYEQAMALVARYQGGEPQGGCRDVHGGVCSAGQFSLSIDPYGNVTPCLSLHLPLGNVKETSLKEIWEGSAKLKALRQVRFCDVCRQSESCPHKDHCGLCLGTAGYVPGQETIIPRETCMIAQANESVCRRMAARA